MGQRQPVQVYVLVTEEHDRGKPAGHAFGQARPGSGGPGCRFGRDASGLQERGRGVAAAFGSAAGGPARGDRWTSANRQRSAVRPSSCGASGGDACRTAEPVVEHQTEPIVEHRDRVAAAGGEMLGAVFNFLGELVSQDRPSRPPSRWWPRSATGWPSAWRRIRRAGSG